MRATGDLALGHPGHVASGRLGIGATSQPHTYGCHDVFDPPAAGELLGLQDGVRQRHPGLAAVAVGEAHAGSPIRRDATASTIALDDAGAVDVLADDDEGGGALGVGHESSPSVS